MAENMENGWFWRADARRDPVTWPRDRNAKDESVFFMKKYGVATANRLKLMKLCSKWVRRRESFSDFGRWRHVIKMKNVDLCLPTRNIVSGHFSHEKWGRYNRNKFLNVNLFKISTHNAASRVRVVARLTNRDPYLHPDDPAITWLGHLTCADH